eukprot:Nitzschia sp. Nitz4//scaffold2_size372955//340537//341983//NITZ4_000474-RA/size372955-snap-gene-0.110-mRNA-1//-1//CDS//3329546931//1919//frame0
MAHSGAASGGELEEKVDLTGETDAKLEQSASLASSGQVSDALALLAALEKKCRVGNDTPNLVRVCEASINYCHDAGDSELLITTLQTLSTRRSQKTQAVRVLVQTAIPWCLQDQYQPVAATSTQQEEERNKLVVTLRDITDGKIFLEGERARLTRALANIKEQAGDVAAAADILQEVHVETYGSLSKKEKVEFILEQMRLTLAKQDYVRAAIVAGKVSKKHLAEDSMQDYKVRFYTLMADYHRQAKDAFMLAKDYHAIYSTPNIKEDESLWKPALQATVLFLLLSPYSNEQQDMLNRLSLDTNIEKIPTFEAALKLFLKQEIIAYPMPQQAELEAMDFFCQDNLASVWHDFFYTRIIQHNVRIASKYYRRIHGARLAQLLGLQTDRLEREISAMVSDGSLYAKIDRPKDIVRFASPQSAEEVLSEWSSDMDKLLHLVETTTHLINKENMTNKK